jgi:ribosomal protein S18 acetylase RimI-like enzyme
VEQVLGLWRRAAAEPSVTDDAGALRRRLARDPDLFLLAWDRRRLVGTLMGGWDGWRGHLYRLAVDPACRRRGIARRLVREVEARLRRLGAVRIDGIVVQRNRRAGAFWSELGYRRHVEVARYVKDLSS